MILSSLVNTFALTSGTINFLVGSILHAEELSITVVPAAANNGASSNEVPPPAENTAISGFIAIAVAAVTTLYFLPLYSTSLPTDFSDATGISSVIGKLRSLRTLSIWVPTKPVAPTTATFICLLWLINYHFFKRVAIYHFFSPNFTYSTDVF